MHLKRKIKQDLSFDEVFHWWCWNHLGEVSFKRDRVVVDNIWYGCSNSFFFFLLSSSIHLYAWSLLCFSGKKLQVFLNIKLGLCFLICFQAIKKKYIYILNQTWKKCEKKIQGKHKIKIPQAKRHAFFFLS